MIDLHEELSEFSYGYGVTRESEDLLASVGLSATPFLPSLVKEASLGFDVGFDRPGRALLLQFKLGNEMQRFRVQGTSPPLLDRPFWRFRIDTRSLQFKLLYRHERRGAEVYYVAPKFTSWSTYEELYVNKSVLEHSVLTAPTRVRTAAKATKPPKAWHQVVYDNSRDYVCSEPMRFDRLRPRDMAEKLAKKIRQEEVPLGKHLVRLARVHARGRSRRAYSDRLQRLQIVADTEEEQAAKLLGLDLWSRGTQLVFVNLPKSEK